MNEPILIKRDCYDMAVTESGETGEIRLYGNVSDKRPVDLQTGEKDSGDYIIQSEFIEDLEKIGNPKTLNIYLSSLGGMVSVALVIHNKLRELAKQGTDICCTVDGVAMSAGSVIMSAADNVKVYPSSLVMIHKSSMLVCDHMNADALKKAAETLSAYDKAIAAVYKRKTGKSDDELLQMMSAETYMTGAEAVEKGFADELLSEESKTQICASADKSAIIVNGHTLSLCGAKCPENIPVVDNAVSKAVVNATDFIDTAKKTKEANVMADTKTPAAEQGQAGTNEQRINAAVLAERERLSKIDAIAAQFSAEIVAEAKYTKPCTAEELAYRAALINAQKGADYLAAAESDAQSSGANEVVAAAAPDDKTENMMTDAELLAKAKADIKAIFGGEE